MFYPNSDSEHGGAQARLNHNIAIEVFGQKAAPMLEKGTALPTRTSRLYSTAIDNQNYVEIHLLYGGGDHVIDNLSLGKFIFDNILPAPRGKPQIEITVSVDAAHVLTVRARDQKTRREESLGQAISLLELKVPPYDESKRPHVAAGANANFEEIFEEYFKPFVDSKPKQPDGSLELKLTFEEAVRGTTKTVQINRTRVCATCQGSGSQDASDRKTCPKCAGSGQIRGQTDSFLGVVIQMQECTQCKGTGSITQSPCSACQGRGKQNEHKQIKVKVPARVKTGTIIRITGEGDMKQDGQARGNVLLVVRAEPHAALTLLGDNIHCTLRLNKDQAARGGRFSVPTLDGMAEITVPSRAADGLVLVLKGQGAPLKAGSAERGDQHVTVTITRLFGLF